MKTVANRIDLGMTRIAGYTLYDELTKEFQEITPKEVKLLISKNEVNGLKLIKDKIELDEEEFNMTNLVIKSAVGKFRTLYPSSNIINSMYSVVRVIETDNGRLYETINNKSARVKVTEDKLRILMEIGCVAGVKLLSNGEIYIYNGVKIEDKRTIVSAINEVIDENKNNNSEIVFDSLDFDIPKELKKQIYENSSEKLSDIIEEEKRIEDKKEKTKSASTKKNKD